MRYTVLIFVFAVAALGLTAFAISSSSSVPSTEAAIRTPPAQPIPIQTSDFESFELVTGDWELRFRNLALYPVLLKQPDKAPVVGHYLNLQEGLQAGNVTVQEIGGDLDGARVNTLEILNTSTDTLFLMAGELVDGKQDRVLASNYVIPPGGKAAQVDAFCVEQGRWTGSGDGASFKDYKNVANFSLRKRVIKQKDQQAVWEEVSKQQSEVGTYSSTGSFNDIEADTAIASEKQCYIEFFEKKMERYPDAVGLVVVTGSSVKGCDLFISPSLFVKQYKTLLHGYVSEAMTLGSPVTIGDEQVLAWFAETQEEYNRERETDPRMLHFARME